MQDLISNSCIGTEKSKWKKSFCGFNNSSHNKKRNLGIRSDSEDSNSSSQNLDLSLESSDPDSQVLNSEENVSQQ